MTKRVLLCGVIALMSVGGAAARAGSLRIDDTSDPGIVIGANDFEGGLLINGQLFQQGLGQPNTGTFDEAAPITFDGRWITHGQATPGSFLVYFVEAQNPTRVSDILSYDVTNEPTSGFSHITGSFQSDVTGDLGPLPTNLPANARVFVEDGSDVDASQAFLTFTVNSAADPVVPEPASLALFGLGAAGLAGHAWRRRRKAIVK